MFRWLVNVGLLVLPIAATLGILIGLQAHRQAFGQQPLFTPPITTKWLEQTYCQKSYGVHPDIKGQQYTLNPNQWAIKPGDEGFLCMNVTTYDNQTYATETTAPQFKVFWQYPQYKTGQPVHAFPNIKVDGDVLPVKLERVQEMEVDFQWTMRLDNDTGPTSSLADLANANVNSNVAIDMFVDSDLEKAQDSERAKYEVMVWFAAIGPATFAIGQDDKPIMSKKVDGTNFNLYYGLNARQQNVLTWKSTSMTDDFHGDLTPLIRQVFQTKRDGFPSSSDYLGYFSFGSEAYYSDKTVTFSVPSLSIDIRETKS
ncbi:glycoside hydrolase family 12 protein [Ophiocordyceps camponoti-floridani]|uniref:Glycoside hydrolase family 12 protein n=1 Tax=Ophiocordyceps camponoti-floridani TaxID=2030778 RepID=A0A8H4QAE6_9HYPO|nr:glycoside hydrolase family 12 protein [Ophiocordyceps camponoti-floridani]